MDSKAKTVAVGMSGGVDSTMAVCLLKKQGYDVIGLTMQIWGGASPDKMPSRDSCYSPREIEDLPKIKALCSRLGIPHHTVDLREEYERTVLDYFREEYSKGKTPNPCVICNRHIKFGALVDKALASGIKFDFFATGHYVRVKDRNGLRVLKKGMDGAKDQSYFLWGLTQKQLSRLMFPIGDFSKREIKTVAAESGFKELAEQPESQDFIPQEEYGEIFRNVPVSPGKIVDTSGRVVGEHKGIIYYTIGQRKGIGIGGSAEPLYVVRLDACKNTVVVGRKEELFSSSLTAVQVNWTSGITPEGRLRILAKIRRQHPEAPAVAEVRPDGSVAVTFDEPQMSVTPGQSVVFYLGEEVVGGGIIDSSI